MFDRKVFFDECRAGVFRGKLTPAQVDGCNALLDAWEMDFADADLKELAYCLATAFHETAATMQPIREYGRGRGKRYGRRAGPYKKRYYGRGFVQLTWLANYKKAKRKLGVDLVRNPDLAMQTETAADILYLGMAHGWFTGKKLSDYISPTSSDYKNARRIVNGMDRASLIAGYARQFEDDLEKAAAAFEVPDILEEPVETSNKPAAKSTTIWSALGGAVLNGFSAVLTLGESQPILAGVIVVAGLAFAIWIIRERRLKAYWEGI